MESIALWNEEVHAVDSFVIGAEANLVPRRRVD